MYPSSHQTEELPVATSPGQLYVSVGCGSRCGGIPYRERIWLQAGTGDNMDLGFGWSGPTPGAPAAALSMKEHRVNELRPMG